MKLMLHKLLVFAAFSLLLAHNLTPHHHHGTWQVEQTHHHDEGEHGHHHHDFSFHSVDENFVFQSFNLKITPPSAIAAVVLFADDYRKIAETEPFSFIPIPSGHPPAPPFLKAFSFRGPPVV
jgi:hypothetical protein